MEMGKVILELNLEQDMASMYQEPLLLVFLSIRKAYNTLDHGRLLKNMEGYGVVPCMYRLLEFFWDQKEVFTLQKRVPRTVLQGNSGDHPGWTHPPPPPV